MLTPKFSISQDEMFIYLNIYIPHIKLSEVECHIDNDEFYFYSDPYYLRLHLPGNILDDSHSQSVYNSDTGYVEVRVTKETRGEHFDGLDLLTKLLTPKTHSVKSCIEVVSDHDQVQNHDQKEYGEQKKVKSVVKTLNDELDACVESDDWYVSQTVDDTVAQHPLFHKIRYGFASSKTNPLNELSVELSGMLDVKEPDFLTLSERKSFKWQQEENCFSCEHYLSDLFDSDMIQAVVSLDLPNLTEGSLSDTEKEELMQLPRKEFLIEDSKIQSTYLALVDILFAYAYEYRFTNGEPSVESDWTICKLSSTLSWLDEFQNLKDVVISCARRCLTFPLYRSWTMFEKVLSDVRCIFQGGKKQILKCLLSVQSILARSEIRYPLNDIFITDYCVWIQSADTKKIRSLSEALVKLSICKSEVGFRLEEMEEDAKKFLDQCDNEEEGDVNQLIPQMNAVKITEKQETDSDDNEDADDNDDGIKEDVENKE